STANNYQVSDVMPPGTVLSSVLNPSGACDTTAGIKCTLSSLRPGNVAVITLVAKPAVIRPGVYMNSVSISAAEPDPNLANNTASATATIYGDFLPLVADYKAIAPDLIVSRMLVSRDNVQVVVKNIGVIAVTDPFWVDIYVNP